MSLGHVDWGHGSRINGSDLVVNKMLINSDRSRLKSRKINDFCFSRCEPSCAVPEFSQYRLREASSDLYKELLLQHPCLQSHRLPEFAATRQLKTGTYLM